MGRDAIVGDIAVWCCGGSTVSVGATVVVDRCRITAGGGVGG